MGKAGQQRKRLKQQVRTSPNVDDAAGIRVMLLH